MYLSFKARDLLVMRGNDVCVFVINAYVASKDTTEEK